MREPASFWQENVIAVVILLRVLARMSWWWKQVIKCQKFYHFAIWGGLWCPFLKGVPSISPPPRVYLLKKFHF